MLKSFLFVVSICVSFGLSQSAVAQSSELSADAEREVARFFELTNAINVAPVKRRLEALINRKLKHENSGINSAHFKVVSNVVTQEVNALVAQQFFVKRYSKVYLRHYTVDELKQVNDFFSSPAGKKFITARAALQEEVSTSTIKMIHRLVDDLSPKVKASLHEAGHQVNL
jgi:hypothetical protein